MSAKATRLGFGEWLLGFTSVLLLIDMFGVSWFAYAPRYHAIAIMLGQRVSATGWETFSILGPLALIVSASGLAAAWSTASRPSPAVPVVITTLLAPLALLLAVLVAIRVLLDRPAVHLAQAGGANVITVRPGAVAGVVLGFGVFAGCLMALRRDGVAAADTPGSIPTLRVEGPRTGSPA